MGKKKFPYGHRQRGRRPGSRFGPQGRPADNYKSRSENAHAHVLAHTNDLMIKLKTRNPLRNGPYCIILACHRNFTNSRYLHAQNCSLTLDRGTTRKSSPRTITAPRKPEGHLALFWRTASLLLFVARSLSSILPLLIFAIYGNARLKIYGRILSTPQFPGAI